jgi:peptide methionine sulfoxide reductase msrA/msrB
MSMKSCTDTAKKGVAAGIVGVALLAVWVSLSAARGTSAQSVEDKLLIDSFSNAREKGVPTAKWQFMGGGARAGRMQIQEYEGRTCLHLMGTPATALQSTSRSVEAQRSLYSRRRPFDAHAYEGIQLTAKGNGGVYAVHLRTADARQAGQYYRSEFNAEGQWQQIKLPFWDFAPVAMVRRLDPAQLMSLSIVVNGKEPNTDLYVDEIAFYREQNMNRRLTPEEERVIVYRGTERPFTGKYNAHFEKGVYTCKRCGTELFESSSKFRSDCGWPSFDEQIPGRVKWQPDPDGMRTEIICNNCGAHLGHVFLGEHYTEKNARYCVNSISMDFIPAEQRAQRTEEAVGADPRARSEESGQLQGVAPTDPQSELRNPPSSERAIFASGCFWGTEYYMQRAPGVISTTVGFTGGHVAHPTYKQVCTGRTGHAESVEIIYDPSKTSYEELAKLFFETHDFTQWNRQGPDIGPQYRSAIFYLNDEQKQIAERLVRQLRQMGYDVKTEITRAGPFWPAEDYHQDYYNKTGKTPYCHIYRPIFKPQPGNVAVR